MHSELYACYDAIVLREAEEKCRMLQRSRYPLIFSSFIQYVKIT